MTRLVLGYGNELRGDDSVGPRLARILARWRLSGVESRALRQLTPELTADLARAYEVVFVDAADTAALEVRELDATWATSTLGHTSDPAGLLALTDLLYGHHPAAWLLLVPATDFGLGQRLSRRARQGMREALAWLRANCRSIRNA